MRNVVYGMVPALVFLVLGMTGETRGRHLNLSKREAEPSTPPSDENKTGDLNLSKREAEPSTPPSDEYKTGDLNLSKREAEPSTPPSDEYKTGDLIGIFKTVTEFLCTYMTYQDACNGKVKEAITPGSDFTKAVKYCEDNFGGEEGRKCDGKTLADEMFRTCTLLEGYDQTYCNYLLEQYLVPKLEENGIM